ncbi:hypothetical protein WA026_007210 [Henosepilachna vigintioctopunctata]|uniref:Elongator complex protein 2 n=1 Tax=Henosepilachna vigintioctopunctata TaxID=420089 RepID=A0AAW1VC19_9CUCU
MENKKFESIYISSNCNQCTNALHWGNNNLICYASSNSVCIYDPEVGSGGKVTHTLAKHSGLVNSVRWLKGSDIPDEDEIISGSVDGNVIVWTKNVNDYSHEVLGHTSNITLVDGLYKEENKKDAVVVAAAMDGTVKIWLRKTPTENFTLRQTIEFGYNISIAMRISILDYLNNQLILAVTLDDSTIRIYLEEDDQQLLFKPSVKLKGHEDWVCGLDFTRDGEDILLASSSQDNFIRIWRITKQERNDLNEEETANMRTLEQDYRIYVESVLIGHEGWVYSVAWNPVNKTLLSCSWDKTMVIWEFDEENNLWLDNIRVGEVGGNTLGFFGGMFGPDGDSMLGYGYHGAFHVWRNNGVDWSPSVTVGGHFKDVTDLAWDPEGSYLFSVSADQTCRIHAPWVTDSIPITWHEIARPQVHGYDMNSIAVFSKYKYASASEEKVIRAFAAPQNFIDNYRRICKVDNSLDQNGDISDAPKGASVPSLGLSNKAVYNNDNSEHSQKKSSKDIYPEESHFSAVDLEEPPTEETLLQNTLWPEIRKLYGHGYEVYCLASSADGNYLASACKSTTQEHAAVLLWDTSDWKLIQKLISHSLTVAQISFSPDSQRILTVSRDRRWTIFEKNIQNQFILSGTTNKATGVHARVIWCCCWTHDSKFFSTGSRDGKLAVWTKNSDKPVESVLGQYEPASTHLSLPKDSITAVASAPCFISGQYLFAVGLECGIISFYKWSRTDLWQRVLEFDRSIGHHLTVKRIQFRPFLGQAGYKEKDENILQVASCSADSAVKIFNLIVSEL